MHFQQTQYMAVDKWIFFLSHNFFEPLLDIESKSYIDHFVLEGKWTVLAGSGRPESMKVDGCLNDRSLFVWWFTIHMHWTFISSHLYFEIFANNDFLKKL